MALSNAFSLLQRGGLTMVVLVACSIGMVAVVIERWYVFAAFRRQLALGRSGGRVQPWFAAMVRLPLPHDIQAAERAHEANMLRVTGFLQARLPLLATVGSLAPFIGLFGTVLGIMRSFEAISMQRGAGIDVVGAGIAEALVNTAAGLVVAIISVLCFNLFRTWMRQLTDALELLYLEHCDNTEAPAK